MPKLESDTVAVVLCDLTLEDKYQIDKVIEDAYKLLLTSTSHGKKFYFYLLDENIRDELFFFQRPQTKYSISHTITERKLKLIETRKFDKYQEEMADKLRDTLRFIYKNEYEKKTAVARSCHFRSLSKLNRILRGNAQEEDLKIVIFLSDMVVKCKSSFCGEKIFFTEEEEQSSKSVIESCDVKLSLDYIDKIAVIESPTYTGSDLKALRPEKVEELWRFALAKFGLSTDRVDEILFVPKIPLNLFKH